MAKLTRYLQKIFANNSNQVGVFGTGVDKETSKNVETLQSADYENGWSSAIITNKNYPIWQEMDGVQYGFSYQLAYLMQNGIPEWLSTETYYQNSYCRVGSTIYYSLQDNNIGHNPALNDGYWSPLLTSNRSIGEIIPSCIPLTEAGLHLLDGALISNGIYADFINYIGGLSATYPDLFTTEALWQQSVSTYGVCGKFVYDSVNNTVRLPKLGNQIYTTGQNQNSFDVDVYGNGKVPTLINGNGAFYNLCMDKTDNHYLSALLVPNGTPSPYDLVGDVSPGNTYQTPEGFYGFNTDPNWSGLTGSVDLTDLSHSETVYYYIVIATSTKTNIEVDIDEIATDLNGKADVDLTNCTKPHIVETYVNGASWYRVYSDGWCEQGGTGDTAAQASNFVALLKAYADTNYTLLATNNFQELGNQVNIQAVKTSSSKFNINAKRYGDNTYYVRSYCWYACGYIR